MPAVAHAFGPLVVVTPEPRFHLPKAAWLDLNLAIVSESDGDEPGARALIRRLEDRLGITARDRFMAEHGREPDTEAHPEVAARRRQRRDAERRLRHTLSGRNIRDQAKPTSEQLDSVTEAEKSLSVANTALAALVQNPPNRKEARAIRAKAREARNKAKEIATRVATELHESTEWNYRARVAAEREELAERRQEELKTETVDARIMVRLASEGILEDVVVPRVQRVTRIRNITRDGLESLYTPRRLPDGTTARTVNQIQRAAGIRYRRMYEELAEDLGSCMGDPGKVRGPQNDTAAIERAMARRRLAEQMKKLEARVVRDVSKPDLSLQALRGVAGLGQNIMEMASSGSRRTALREALIEALDVLADAWGIH